MPTELANPNPTARFVTVIASSGLRIPPPMTELILTANFRVFREKFEFLVEHLEALHGHVIGLDVVYADLQVVQSGIH
jgi:hypothetical protein